MKVGIISDTHGSMEAVDWAVSEAQDVELWIHAGDCSGDHAYLAKMSGVEVLGVAGNCDWPNENIPDERVVEAGGHRILVAHGHTYGVRYGTDMLAEAARDLDCDIAVYGHTHVMECVQEDVCILNPGSAARPRDEVRPSFMTVELAEGKRPEVETYRRQV